MVLFGEVDEPRCPLVLSRERWIMIEPAQNGLRIRLPTLPPAARPVDGHARGAFAGGVLVVVLVRQDSIQVETVAEARYGER